ncbi:GTPase [Candidatus Woesearchaeota archaeon]|jgi:ribosome biogenesis GTPase A|nr:GTPase [Candidatus Woesearchaeota archaeon]MBT7367914.1 GTPase [Candidatus Woesearchaeota archaeon]
MPNFWNVVNKVIRDADILLEVLDARHVDESRNIEVEQKVQQAGKKLIYVINKCDLINKSRSEQAKKGLNPCVFISAKDHLGTTKLREMIMRVAKGKQVKVGVLGFPNTGKSSLINALKGSGAAKTSSQSGFTKGEQRVRASKRLILIDTPGVIPYRENADKKHVKISAIDFSRIKEPDIAAMNLIDELDGVIEAHYGVEGVDSEEIVEKIALKYRKLGKGGLPDLDVAGRMILRDWQIGKIKQ